MFMSEGYEGARTNYLRYMFEPLLVSMGDVREPDDKRCSEIVVIRVSDKDVHEYETNLYDHADDPYCGMHFAAFEGRIYTGYLAQGKIWKWADTHFEPVASDDLRAFDAEKVAAMTASHPWQFDSVGGWSMRELGATSPRYEFTLNGQPVTLIFQGKNRTSGLVSVDWIRSGQSPQTIWSFDGRPRRVTRIEYARVLAQR